MNDKEIMLKTCNRCDCAKEVDELLLDVLNQACGDGKGNIDNMCISAYEDACDHLTKKGYLKTTNGRIYLIEELENE